MGCLDLDTDCIGRHDRAHDVAADIENARFAGRSSWRQCLLRVAIRLASGSNFRAAHVPVSCSAAVLPGGVEPGLTIIVFVVGARILAILAEPLDFIMTRIEGIAEILLFLGPYVLRVVWPCDDSGQRQTCRLSAAWNRDFGLHVSHRCVPYKSNCTRCYDYLPAPCPSPGIFFLRTGRMKIVLVAISSGALSSAIRSSCKWSEIASGSSWTAG